MADDSRSKAQERSRRFPWPKYIATLLGIIYWTIVAAKREVFLASLDDSLEGIYPYFAYIILCGIALYSVLRVAMHAKAGRIVWEIIVFFARIFLLPLRILFYAFKILAWIFRLGSRLTKLSTHAEVQLFAIVFWGISIGIIRNSTTRLVTLFAVITLALAMMLLWLSLFLWTIKPLRLFSRLQKIVDWLWEKMISQVTSKEETDASDEKKKKSDLSTIFTWSRLSAKSGKQVDRWLNQDALKPILIVWFLALYIVILAISVIGFANIYTGIEVVNPASFNSLDLTIGRYLYASSMMTFTLNADALAPATNLAKTIVLFQGICSFFFFIILILTFTTVTESVAKAQMTTLSLHFQGLAKQGADIAVNQFGANREKFQTAYDTSLDETIKPELLMPISKDDDNSST